MTLAKQIGTPSTLADVIGQVVDAFDAMGDATPISVGAAYLEEGHAPLGILFVPDVKGKIGSPLEMGGPASITHSCDVYVRAPETGDDVTRFRDVYALGDLVIGCIATAAPGRIEWGEYSDNSPTDVDAFGAELVLSFSYTRDLRHESSAAAAAAGRKARWALAAATADSSDPQPGVPPGAFGEVDSVTPTVTPKESS